MHAEHAELIAALRAENARLTVDNAELSGLRAIIDAQDKLLMVAADTMKRQQEHIERLARELRSFVEAAP